MEFLDRMEAGRVAAAARRHKGLGTGKSAAGWNAKPRPKDFDRGTWHEESARITADWKLAAQRALWDYADMVFPERRFDGMTMDDVMARIETAERDALLATF